MSAFSEIQGIEFDWFAIDSLGQVATMATAGEGFVPESVLSSFTKHQEIAECIETKDWGSEAVWGSYANAGLFVYDWSLSHEMYVLKARPSTQISADLLEKLTQLHEIPRLSKPFKESDKVRPDEFM